jgi:squalene-hopene/tetraprenyl-beta-curcumene cyclase
MTLKLHRRRLHGSIFMNFQNREFRRIFVMRRMETQYLVDSFFEEKLEQANIRARNALIALQHREGYWAFELEADCTIPAEYIIMMHYMGEVDEKLQAKLAVYLRDRQADHGGWPLFYGGAFDTSCSVKAYYALKLAGDSPDALHMVKAREAILAHGGAARSNVFTRMTLALFGQLPWRGVPFTPVEIILFPPWFYFVHFEAKSQKSEPNADPGTVHYSA